MRIFVGIVMTLEAWALVRPNAAAITAGTTPLQTYYIGSDIRFHFPYELFDWLPLLPPSWIYSLVVLLAISGITMALGLFYRVSAALVFISWGYLYAVESTRTYWQSHYYLELLTCFLMIWMPAAQKFSLDAIRRKVSEGAGLVPYWTVVLLRGQLVIAYFYAGVAKINVDWILDAVPVRWFMADRGVMEPLAKILSPDRAESIRGILESPAFAYLLSYTGLLFDLLIGLLLLPRRTRIFGLILMLIFHATNHLLIFDDIGWFPALGSLTALIFLEPDWPERFARWVKQPQIVRPDFKWFGIGAIVFPVVGAALGWRLNPTTKHAAQRPLPIGRAVPWFVLSWLAWQSLLPLRHYAIPGDARFTYEGLSFSWRLKADVRQAVGVQLFVHDPGLINQSPDGASQIDWSKWTHDPILYRRVNATNVDWTLAPEIVIARDPLAGERILYNPHASGIRNENAARARINEIWRELYQRTPAQVEATQTLSVVIESIASGLRAGGHLQEAGALSSLVGRLQQVERGNRPEPDTKALLSSARRALAELNARAGAGEMLPHLRRIAPFALDGATTSATPFLLIHDPELFDTNANVRKDRWRAHATTRDQRMKHTGADPIIVHVFNLATERPNEFPQAVVTDTMGNQVGAPAVWWNVRRDANQSKFLHMSNQAFYLRRYARRVATLWEQEYGRRPAVTAVTSVTFNGRPHQPLVDPDTDLATVTVKRFGHNDWIRDLEVKRIPEESLNAGARFLGR